MIETLRRKFIAISISSLMLIMVLIIASIYIVSWRRVDNITDGALQTIAEHDGKFPDFPKEDRAMRPPPGGIRYGFQQTPETRYETRYFTVMMTADGEVQQVNTEHIAAIDTQSAEEYARTIWNKTKPKGYIGYYKYLLVEKAGGVMILVLDCRHHLEGVEAFFQISCLIALCSLVLMLVLVSFLSKRAVYPVKVSLEKQRQFITDAGHEIKTPLTIISSNADVLELTQGDSEWLASIRKQISRLDNLIKRLLTLSKIEEGAGEEIRAEFSLTELVQEGVEAFSALAAAQNKTLCCEAAEAIRWTGDEEEVRQLVVILLDNGVKYAPPGTQVHISLTTQGKKLRLEVRNQLTELPVQDPNRLFDRFFRADASRSRESGGYGIGLSIARAIAEKNKGTITALYESGGTVLCFQVKLPNNTPA